MKHIISLIFILCISFEFANIDAQPKMSFPHVAEMTPNAASIAKFQDIPVSYYTGVPQISIPLYEINVDDFKLPITMNYHATGIPVAQEASWVGLGWSLDIGGRISRTIKCSNDLYDTDEWDSEFPYVTKGYYYAPAIKYTTDPYAGAYPNVYKIMENPTNYDAYYYNTVLDAFWFVRVYDSEPDVFYYNLPSESGKFIFDKSQKAVLFDKNQNISVEVLKDGNRRCYFVVKDSGGNTYYFHHIETTQNYRQKAQLNKNGTIKGKYDEKVGQFIQWVEKSGLGESDYDPAPANPTNNISSWCLTEIVTNKNRHIYFNYEYEDQYLPAQESCEIYNTMSIDGNFQNSYKYYYESKVVNRALRLSSIKYDYGTIKFSCSERYDINSERGDKCKKLDCISIYDNNSNCIKSISFGYDYFNEDYVGEDYEHVFARLKLTKIYDNTLDNPYTFKYNEGEMPAKNSKNVDYWGYSNGRDYGEDYCIGVYYNGKELDGIKKDANFDYAIIGTLTEIDYPTGGYHKFHFESNSFPTHFYYVTNDDKSENKNNEITPIYVDTYNSGSIGDRAYEEYPEDTTITFTLKSKGNVKFVCALDNVSGERDKEFNYGENFGELIEVSPNKKDRYLFYEFPLLYESPGIGSDTELTKEYELEAGTYEFYTGVLPEEVHAQWGIIIDYEGTPGSYSSSTSSSTTVSYDVEEHGGGLRIKSIESPTSTRSYTYEGGKLLVEPVLSYTSHFASGSTLKPCVVQISESRTPMSTFNNGWSVGYDCVTEIIEDDDNPSYTKYYYKNEPECELFDYNFTDGPVNIIYTNGLIEKSEVYDDEQLVKKTEYEYDTTHSATIDAIYDRNGHFLTDESLQYSFNIEWPLKSHESETIIDSEGREYITDNYFSYNSLDLPSKIMTETNLGTTTNYIYYPFDILSNGSVYSNMAAANILSTPVEILSLKDDKIYAANRASYIYQNDMFVIDKNEELAIKNAVTENSFDRNNYYPKEEYIYNTQGHIRQYTNSNGQCITYLWGYNNMYPIVRIEGAKFEQLVNVIALNDIEITEKSEDQTVITAFLSSLRDSLKDSGYLVTTYTYKPLVGMTTQTSPNGVSTYYEYDSKNRLVRIKDTNGKILKSLEYNYTSDTDN